MYQCSCIRKDSWVQYFVNTVSNSTVMREGDVKICIEHLSEWHLLEKIIRGLSR